MNNNGFIESLNHDQNYTNIKELIEESFKRFELNDLYGYEEEISQEAIKKSRSRKLTSNKEIKWIKYKEVYKDALLLKNYIKENKKLFLIDDDSKMIIAINANKSYMTLLTILATMIYEDNDNILLFPLYEMMDYNALDKVLEQVKPKSLFIDNASLDNILKLYQPNSQSKIRTYLNTLVLFDKDESFNCVKVSNDLQYKNILEGVSLMNFSDMLNKDQEHNNSKEGSIIALSSMEILALSSTEYKLCRIKSIELLYTINDLLTFESFHYNQHDIYYQTNSFGDITEIVFLLILIQSGSRISFCNNLSDFFSTIDILHPTILNNYPYIWKKIYVSLQNIILSLNNEQHSIVTKAIKVRMNEEKKDLEENHNEDNENDDSQNINEENGNNKKSVWDKLVFDKIKVKFGSKIRLMFTSNDRLNTTISKFIEMSLKAKFIQIYGTTESCGFISIGKCSSIHLGNILPSKNISLEICNAIGYYSLTHILKENNSKFIEDSCGEVIVIGKGLYSSYYNTPHKTSNATCHTGDYCMFIRKNFSYDTINDAQSLKIVFIDKIANFLYDHKKQPISPSIMELYLDETFNGTVSNIYLSKRDDMNQLVIVGRVNMTGKCENPQKLRTEAINEISKYIEGHSLRNELIPHANDKKNNLCIFLIEKFEKVFSVKYKMNRKLLKEEIQLREKDN